MIKGTTNEIVESSSRDNKQPMIEPQSNSFSNQAAGSNPAAHPSSRQVSLFDYQLAYCDGNMSCSNMNATLEEFISVLKVIIIF